MLFRVERQRIVTEVFLVHASNRKDAAEALTMAEEYMADEFDDECEEPTIEEHHEVINDKFNNVWSYENEALIPATTCARVAKLNFINNA